MSRVCCTVIWMGLLSSTAWAAGPPLAEWRFDEGSGDIARDGTGNGHHARLHGATWVKTERGFALSLDGTDDYVDCAADKALALEGPLSIEAWIRPTRNARGEAMLIGEGIGSFALTYYNTELCHFYLGGGGNNVKEHLTVDRWQHVAASFDGQRLHLWINGQRVDSRPSKKTSVNTNGRITIGTKGAPDAPRFKGLIDNVRVYNRALTEEEVLKHVKDEAVDHELAVAAPALKSAANATRFFRSHPNEIDLKEQGNSILFANRQIGLEIIKGERGFQVQRLYGVEQDHDFLAAETVIGFQELFEIRMTPDIRGSGLDRRNESTKPGLMGIMDEMAADAFSVGTHSANSVSWKQSQANGNTTLHLHWNDIHVRGDQHIMDVEVKVTLRPGDPMSYWRINILNPGIKYGLERVRFPLFNLAPIGDAKDNVYIYPREHGGYVEDPFNNRVGVNGFYPLHFNMQFNALYDRVSGKGIYLATQDSTPNLMQVKVANTPQHVTWKVAHFPPNITFAEESYWLPYDCVVGPFEGDWYDAAQIYRKWALQQYWCSKGPLRTRADSPKWFKEAPFMFYTTIADSAQGTHSLPENARIAADHFREYLQWAKMPLPANWYGWKEYVPGMTSYNAPFGSHRLYHQGRWKGLPPMNIHDGNYPAIGSIEAYIEENRKLRKEGGMICPYVALEIFDQGPDDNSPFAREARPHVVRGLYGVKRMWSNETAWQMCVATEWWQNRLEETCRIMTEREHIGGFYLDVMQGCGLPCYWTPHGHSASGGEAITTGMHELVERCFIATKTADPETIITGENITENVIDVVDGTLQVTLWPENRAHVFAAVYQDFTKRYGTELSTSASAGDSDDFFLECASLFVQGAQIGRIRLRPRSLALSLTDPRQKHMVDFLEQVLGYYHNPTTRHFHAYGQFMRPLAFKKPDPMPMLEYAEHTYRALWNGIFRNEQGNLGLFIANASKQELAFDAAVELARHGMADDSVVDVDRIAPTGQTTSVHRGVKGQFALTGSIPGRSITMYHVKAADGSP